MVSTLIHQHICREMFLKRCRASQISYTFVLFIGLNKKDFSLTNEPIKSYNENNRQTCYWIRLKTHTPLFTFSNERNNFLNNTLPICFIEGVTGRKKYKLDGQSESI